jgi:hypothetical protein
VAARKSSDYGRLFFQAEVFRAGRLAERRKRPDATVTEPAQRVPVREFRSDHDKTDALILRPRKRTGGHVRVSTMRRQLSFKNGRRIIFENDTPPDLASDNVLYQSWVAVMRQRPQGARRVSVPLADRPDCGRRIFGNRL